MRLIDADALMNDICESLNQMTNIGIGVDGEWLWGKLNDALDNAPTIEPQRMRGKWIPIQRGFFNKEVTQVKCDQCGNLLDLIGVNCGRGDTNFCPNCGAWMGGQDE